MIADRKGDEGLLESSDIDAVDDEAAKLLDDAVAASDAAEMPSDVDLATDV